jgi:hypothetical protein
MQRLIFREERALQVPDRKMFIKILEARRDAISEK